MTRLPMPPSAGKRQAHPQWCAGGHHCTASRRTDGEHASEPEAFLTDVCKIVATRYQRADGSRDRVEVRVVVDLALDDPQRAERQSRVAIAAVYEALARRGAARG